MQHSQVIWQLIKLPWPPTRLLQQHSMQLLQEELRSQ